MNSALTEAGTEAAVCTSADWTCLVHTIRAPNLSLRPRHQVPHRDRQHARQLAQRRRTARLLPGLDLCEIAGADLGLFRQLPLRQPALLTPRLHGAFIVQNAPQL